jgi:hypothetical protein
VSTATTPVTPESGTARTNWRVEKPLFSTVLFAVYVGIAVWAGLYLRDRTVRELLPLRREG